METKSVRFDIIRNTVCIVCGAAFEHPRAGKLYCSGKCKQFYQYHKSEIIELKEAKRGISNETTVLSLKEYYNYTSIARKLKDYQSLLRRSTSTWGSFSSADSESLKELETDLPNYLKELKLQNLTLEEWSFLRFLYHDTDEESLFKLLSSLSRSFFENLAFQDKGIWKIEKMNPIKLLYNNHLLKIAAGKIKFT